MNVTWTESAANQAKVILAGEGDDKLNITTLSSFGND